MDVRDAAIRAGRSPEDVLRRLDQDGIYIYIYMYTPSMAGIDLTNVAERELKEGNR
jgi:hypothetical protein